MLIDNAVIRISTPVDMRSLVHITYTNISENQSNLQESMNSNYKVKPGRL